MFRREWRQQTVVLAMLALVVAATVVGLGLAANADASTNARFGDADIEVTLAGTSPTLSQDVASLTEQFGTVEVIDHASIPIPGSVTPADVRDQDPAGPLLAQTLRLDSGRYPTADNEIAVTDGLEELFKVHLGSAWTVDGRTWDVVGIVENPLNLAADIALVAPGSIVSPETVTLYAAGSFTGSNLGLGIAGAEVAIRPTGEEAQAALVVMLLAAVSSIFVGLVAVAGFSVIAQRRLRGIGMLGALGATARNLRLVMIANGAFVGVAGALTGLALGIAAWVLAVPLLEQLVNHRIDAFHQSWAVILGSVALAVATSVIASWWPARAAARAPIVAALATRPAPPRPSRRLVIPGALSLAVGVVAVALSPADRPIFLVLGVALALVGLLLLAPLGISILAATTARAPVAIRLAARDLARYRARSGGAVAAVSLAVAISAAISISAGAAQAAANSGVGGGNLPDNEIMLWLGTGAGGPIPALSDGSLSAAEDAVQALADELGASSTLALMAAVDPSVTGGNHVGGDGGNGGKTYDPVELGLPHETTDGERTGFTFYGNESVHVFVATSDVLGHYGIAESSVEPDTDLLTSHESLEGYELIPIRTEDGWKPTVQEVALPTYTSNATTLITATAMTELELTAVPTGWLLTLDHPVTQEEKATARTGAADAGLRSETRPTAADLVTLRTLVTAGGVALALAVLGMTVGLIRSETAQDLSTLAATGASSRIRRSITAATAAALALVGGLMGTAAAYLVLVAWHRRDLSVLTPIPALALLALVVGLPLIAWTAGWLLGGREPATIARRRLE